MPLTENEESMAVPGKAVLAAALPVGLLLSGMLVWQASFAAFTATTSSEANSWESGTVALSVDSPGAARFSEGGLVPGDSGARCITVTYTGDVAADVRVYVDYTQAAPTGLAPYLSLNVQAGAGTASPDCTGFMPTEVALFAFPLSTVVADHHTFETGGGTWAPSAPGDTMTYRVWWQLEDDDLAQGERVELDLVWEARSS